MFDRETMGRTAQAEISVYDAMMAEIESAKENRLRKYLRKHELRNGHPVRKEKRKSYQKERCYSCDPWHGFDTVRNFRQTEAEKADARDYELEQEDLEYERFNAELFEYDRKWRAEAQAEIERCRKLREFNEWLKYA